MDAAGHTKAMITQHHVHLRDAHKTRQFWLIWAVLCLNVSAGIGVIGMASPMLQEIFGGSLVGAPDVGFTALNDDQRKIVEYALGYFTDRQVIWWMDVTNRGTRYYHVIPNPRFRATLEEVGRTGTLPVLVGL